MDVMWVGPKILQQVLKCFFLEFYMIKACLKLLNMLEIFKKIIELYSLLPSRCLLLGNCYKILYPSTMTWEVARSRCCELGAQLLTIRSSQENEFVKG